MLMHEPSARTGRVSITAITAITVKHLMSLVWTGQGETLGPGNTRGNLQLKKRFSGAECAGLGVLRCQRNGGGGRAIRPQRFCPVQNRADAAAAAVAAGGAR
jgi:hypothetical protein